MNTHNSLQTLTTMKLMWTRVRTFLMDLFQGLYLVVYLGIRLLPLLHELALEKLFSVSPLSRTSWILILMGIVYILTHKFAVNKSLLADRGIDLNRLVVVNVVTIEDFRGKASGGSILKET